MSKPQSDLTNGPITATLIRFSLPLLVTLLLHTISGSWNAVWVSHVLGPGELIAVVNANVMMGILMALVSGFGVAAGIFVGQAMGADDVDAVHKIVGTAIGFAVAASTLIAVIGLFSVEFIVELLQMPQETRVNSIVYFRIFCLSMPTLFVFIFSTIILRSTGDAKTPFIFSTIWIILGFILTPLLLTGMFGLPRFGIAGAAMGGCIANAVALVSLYIYIYRKDFPLVLRGDKLRYLLPDMAILWQLAKRAIPSAAETMIVQGAYFMLLSLVNAYGVMTAAGYAAAAQLWGYVQLPAFAITASMSLMAAQNIGAAQWGRVNKIALCGCVLSVLATTAMALLVYSLGELPLKLFLPDGGEALQAAQEINKVVLWNWPIVAVTLGLFAIVRANGVMLPSAIIFAVTLWGLRIPFANMLQPQLGAAAIWWSFPLGTFASALLALAYYRWGKWRQQSLIF